MEPLEIGRLLQDRFPDQVLEIYTHRGQAGVLVRRERIVDLCRFLRDTESLRMNHLLALCGVDNSRRKGANLLRFEVVYNLYSIPLQHQLRLRAQVPEDDPVIDSVTQLWPGANWLERETWDLLGIGFAGHPDLRRVLLPESWQGHPLRKDYPLRGTEPWQEYEDLKAHCQQLRQFDFYSQNAPAGTDENNG